MFEKPAKQYPMKNFFYILIFINSIASHNSDSNHCIETEAEFHLFSHSNHSKKKQSILLSK